MWRNERCQASTSTAVPAQRASATSLASALFARSVGLFFDADALGIIDGLDDAFRRFAHEAVSALAVTNATWIGARRSSDIARECSAKRDHPIPHSTRSIPRNNWNRITVLPFGTSLPKKNAEAASCAMMPKPPDIGKRNPKLASAPTMVRGAT